MLSGVSDGGEQPVLSRIILGQRMANNPNDKHQQLSLPGPLRGNFSSSAEVTSQIGHVFHQPQID